MKIRNKSQSKTSYLHVIFFIRFLGSDKVNYVYPCNKFFVFKCEVSSFHQNSRVHPIEDWFLIRKVLRYKNIIGIFIGIFIPSNTNILTHVYLLIR